MLDLDLVSIEFLINRYTTFSFEKFFFFFAASQIIRFYVLLRSRSLINYTFLMMKNIGIVKIWPSSLLKKSSKNSKSYNISFYFNFFVKLHDLIFDSVKMDKVGASFVGTVRRASDGFLEVKMYKIFLMSILEQ